MFSLIHYTEVTATQARISALGTYPGRKKESHIHAFYPSPPVHPSPPPVQLEKVVEEGGGGVMSCTMCVYAVIAADHQHIFSSHMVPSLSSGFKRWIKREHPVFSVCFFPPFFLNLGEGRGRPFCAAWWMRGLTRWWVLPKQCSTLGCTNFTGLRRSCRAHSLLFLAE